jgi:hypothetical protein
MIPGKELQDGRLRTHPNPGHGRQFALWRPEPPAARCGGGLLKDARQQASLVQVAEGLVRLAGTR